MKKTIVCALLAFTSVSHVYANATFDIDKVSYEKERRIAVSTVNEIIMKLGGIERLKKDAEMHNDADSHYALGQMYRFGIVTKQDSEAAIMHLKVAAEKNHPNAAFILSKMLGDKDKVSPAADNSIMDKAGSYELTKKAAELGVVDAQYDLGLYYINGEHFQEDRDLGLFWLSRAADAGHEKSALTRVKFLYNNHELQISYDSVRLRASEGHLPSMVILSQFYSNGWVVQRNEMKAHRLLSAAASMGSKEAIDLLRNGR